MDICLGVFVIIPAARAQHYLHILRRLQNRENKNAIKSLSRQSKAKLLFFVAGDVTDSIREKVRDFVLNLASLRQWLIGPPRFINEREEPLDRSRGDMPIDTLGGCLEIYSAWPSWKLPREIDRQHLDEVTALVAAAREFSRRHKLTFEFELDGTFVGTITDGEMDRCLSGGLLGEWKRHLGA